MRCPYCYEKIPSHLNVCNVCGFRKSELDSASNSLVPQMRKKDPESVIKTTNIPSDLSRKKLFWLVLLGGMLGLHAFYCKRYGRGWFCLIGTIILLIGTPIIYGTIYIPALSFTNVTFSTTVGIFGALSFFIWIYDFVKIIFGRFSIPVVLKDKI